MTRMAGPFARRLPSLRPLEPLPVLPGDVLVHAPGFEDRTFGFVEAFAGGVGLKCVLLDYRPVDGRNQLPEVRRRLVGMGGSSEREDVLTYDRFAPADFEERLHQRLVAIGTERVTVDVSTMSKLAILLVLGVCQKLDLDVRLIYTEAESYGPTLTDFRSARERNEIHRPTLQVFDGVHGVVRVPSLASVAMQGSLLLRSCS